MLANVLTEFQSSVMVQAVFLFIVGDVLLGVLRACGEKNINSSIGIDGIIRKVEIITVLMIAFFADIIFNFNLISFVPDGILEIVNIREIGLAEIFGVLFLAFESLSILKNLERSNIPIPKKIRAALEKILNEFTKEGSDNEQKGN